MCYYVVGFHFGGVSRAVDGSFSYVNAKCVWCVRQVIFFSLQISYAYPRSLERRRLRKEKKPRENVFDDTHHSI